MKTYSNFRKFISEDRVIFFSKRIVNEIKNKDDIGISEIFEKINLNPDDEVTLKVDIEGDEYNIVKDILYYEKKNCTNSCGIS